MWCACALKIKLKYYLALVGLQIFYHQFSSNVHLPFIPYPIYKVVWIKIRRKCKCKVDDRVILGFLFFRIVRVISVRFCFVIILPLFLCLKDLLP